MKIIRLLVISSETLINVMEKESLLSKPSDNAMPGFSFTFSQMQRDTRPSFIVGFNFNSMKCFFLNVSYAKNRKLF